MSLVPPTHHRARILLGHAAKVARREAARLRRSAERLPDYLPTLPAPLATVRSDAVAWLMDRTAPSPARNRRPEPALALPQPAPETARSRLAGVADEATQHAIVEELAAAAMRGSGQACDELALLAVPQPGEATDLPPGIRLAAADGLQAHGERWCSSAALHAAIRSYDHLQATVWRHDLDPASWLALAVRQSAARQALAVLTRNPRGLEDALLVCRAALQVSATAELGTERRALLFNLGRVLHQLGQQHADPLPLEEAAWVFGQLLEGLSRTGDAEEWLAAQVSLGNVLLTQCDVQPLAATARRAAEVFRTAIALAPEEADPSRARQLLRGVARAEVALARLERTTRTARRAQGTLQALLADAPDDRELLALAGDLRALSPAEQAATARRPGATPAAAAKTRPDATKARRPRPARKARISMVEPVPGLPDGTARA